MFWSLSIFFFYEITILYCLFGRGGFWGVRMVVRGGWGGHWEWGDRIQKYLLFMLRVIGKNKIMILRSQQKMYYRMKLRKLKSVFFGGGRGCHWIFCCYNAWNINSNKFGYPICSYKEWVKCLLAFSYHDYSVVAGSSPFPDIWSGKGMFKWRVEDLFGDKAANRTGLCTSEWQRRMLHSTTANWKV